MSKFSRWTRLLKLSVVAVVVSFSITIQIKSSLSSDWKDDRYTGIAQAGYCPANIDEYHVRQETVSFGPLAYLSLPLVFTSKEGQTQTVCFEISNLTRLASLLSTATYLDGTIDHMMAQFSENKDHFPNNLWIIVLSLAAIFLDISFEGKQAHIFENPNQSTMIRRMNNLICFSVAGLLFTSAYSYTNLTEIDCSKLLESSSSATIVREITVFCKALTSCDAVVQSVFDPADTFIQNCRVVLFYFSGMLIFSVLLKEFIDGMLQRAIDRVIQPLESTYEVSDLEVQMPSRTEGILSLLEELRAAATLAVENREDNTGSGREARNCRTVLASNIPREDIALGNCPICLTSLFPRRCNSDMHGDSLIAASYLDSYQDNEDDTGIFDSSLSTMSNSVKASLRSRRMPLHRRNNRHITPNLLDPIPSISVTSQSELGVVELIETSRGGQYSNADTDGSSKISSFGTTNCVTPRATPSDTTVVEAPCGHTFHKSCLREWTAHRSSCPMCRSELLVV